MKLSTEVGLGPGHIALDGDPALQTTPFFIASYQPTLLMTNISMSGKYSAIRMLDHLGPTATGLDALPAWFLRLGAPAFYKPIARLYNLSIATFTVPRQLKIASIKPIPKAVSGLQTDFNYPSTNQSNGAISCYELSLPLLPSSTSKSVIHQPIGFRPTGSPAAAITYVLHTVLHLLTTNPYVVVISLDFSKAFDTVWHSTLLDKLARLELPDGVYNWLVNFFEGHSHWNLVQCE